MATKVSKVVKLTSTYDIVYLQYVLYCFFNGLKLSRMELGVLTTITLMGYSKRVVKELVAKGISTSAQSVRNTVTKLVKLNLLNKTENNGRVINPDIQVGVDSKVLLDIKIIGVDESKAV